MHCIKSTETFDIDHRQKSNFDDAREKEGIRKSLIRIISAKAKNQKKTKQKQGGGSSPTDPTIFDIILHRLESNRSVIKKQQRKNPTYI